MIEMDLNQASIDYVMREVEYSIGDFVVLIGLDAFTSVVVKTPTGNPDLWKSKPPKGYVGGQARHSWNLSHGKPDKSLPVSWSTSIPVAKNITPKGYTPLYLTSSVPYMTRLEDGWSSQGSHMQKRTVSEIQAKFNSIGI